MLGLVAFSYQGVFFVAGTDTLAGFGPAEGQGQKDFIIPLAPIVGGLVIGLGALLLASQGRAPDW